MPLYASFAVIFKGRFRSRRNKNGKIELHEQRCQTEIKNNFEKKTVVNLEDDQKMRFS